MQPRTLRVEGLEEENRWDCSFPANRKASERRVWADVEEASKTRLIPAPNDCQIYRFHDDDRGVYERGRVLFEDLQQGVLAILKSPRNGIGVTRYNMISRSIA